MIRDAIVGFILDAKTAEVLNKLANDAFRKPNDYVRSVILKAAMEDKNNEPKR